MSGDIPLAEMSGDTYVKIRAYNSYIPVYVNCYTKTMPIAQKKFLSYRYSLVEENFSLSIETSGIKICLSNTK